MGFLNRINNAEGYMNISIILNQLDTLFQEKKIEEVETFLLHQINEAKELDDTSSYITLLNELIGYYRDLSKHESSISYAKILLQLLEEEELQDSVAYGTSLNNIGNAYRGAGKAKEALAYYLQVFSIYKENLTPYDFRYASLNNNVSLVYQELNEYEKSLEVLANALGVLEHHPSAVYERATTYTNIANTLLKCERTEKALDYIQLALQIYEKDEMKDFHYSGALSSMAEALYHSGNLKDSIVFYKKALVEIAVNMGKHGTYELVQENMNHVILEYNRIKPKSGLELSRNYYETYGRPMLEEKFPNYLNRIAVGLIGEGSECFGFDDEVSMDHDFGPAFNLFLTADDFKKIGSDLRDAYDNLPSIFMGIQKSNTKELKNRRGVFENLSFIQTLTALQAPMQTEEDFLKLDENGLFLLERGVIFHDPLGEFTKHRQSFLQYYPDAIWRKKLAQSLAMFSQYGQYNFLRMKKRNDMVTANICLHEFIKETITLLYLLNRSYKPYYKWWMKGLEQIVVLKEVKEILCSLDSKAMEEGTIDNQIEAIAKYFVDYLKREHYIFQTSSYLIDHCEDILNPKLKLVESLVSMEWKAFDTVENIGGRADCQDDYETFSIMRKSQYLCFPDEVLRSYSNDFEQSYESGWNLITEKYARMMEFTHPTEYNQIKNQFPFIRDDKRNIVDEIVAIQVSWMEQFAQRYQNIATNARPIRSTNDSFYGTSYETYLRGELLTYGDNTLHQYHSFIKERLNIGENLSDLIMQQTAKLYGYKNLEEMNSSMNL
jgi:tetratricopeptide (TPR) repeat protein